MKKTAYKDWFRTKDLDLITYLRYRSFKHQASPVIDSDGCRWALFYDSPELRRDIVSFLTGNDESCLLSELRKSRRFLLDTRAESHLSQIPKPHSLEGAGQ